MRCFITRDPECAYRTGAVLAWYLLDDGTYVYLREGFLGTRVENAVPNFLDGLERGWDEVSFSPPSR